MSRARVTEAMAAGGLDATTVVPDERGPLSLRWLLVHLAEEHARHVGHADLLREAVDGRTGEQPSRVQHLGNTGRHDDRRAARTPPTGF